jgi:hypothetical protein
MLVQYLVVIVAGIVAVVLQATLLRFTSTIMPVDLLFVLAVILGLFKDPVHGAIKSCALGYVQDLIGPSDIVGMFMTARMTTFLLAQTLRGRLSPDTPLSQFTIGLGLGVADRLVTMSLVAIFSEPMELTFKTVAPMIMGTFINAALVPVIFFLLRLIPGFVPAPRGPRIVG